MNRYSVRRDEVVRRWYTVEAQNAREACLAVEKGQVADQEEAQFIRAGRPYASLDEKDIQS